MRDKMHDTKLVKLQGEEAGFPGEHLRLWVTYNGGKIASVQISGFGRDSNDYPTNDDNVPYVFPVPKDRKEGLRTYVADKYSLAIVDISYWV